jgi:hypothetical protein
MARQIDTLPPFEFPDEDVRWNPDSGCIEFAVRVAEYRGTVRVPAVLFKRFLGQPVSPEKCYETFHLQRTEFGQAVEAKILRRELSEDGNIDLVHRHLLGARTEDVRSR